MKRIICLTIALCLVLGSFSFIFADGWSSSDSTTLSNIYRYMPTSSQITTISNTLSTISTRLLNIYNALFSNDHNITYWVHAISTWMSPLYTAISSIPTNHEQIKRLLGYVSSQDGVETIDPYLAYQTKGIAQWSSDIFNKLNYTGSVALFVAGSGGTSYNNRTDFSSPFQATKNQLEYINKAQVDIYTNEYQNYLNGTIVSQSFTGWSDLENHSFTPTSGFNGLYTWLSKIQTPVARLSYVLASDERIEAQEAAAANEEAVVDNFIDSSGTGSVGVSDFGSLSNASGAMKSNFETGQSAAGVFNVFDDSHFLYLSQSAADQLDTTGSNNQNRLLKSSGNDYDTPALDRYYEELNKILEVNKDD